MTRSGYSPARTGWVRSTPSGSWEPLSRRGAVDATPQETITVALRGDLDAATAAEARGALGDAIAQHPGALVRVDLAEVTHLDSSGVGMLIGAQRRAATAGGDLRVVRPQPRVAGLLRLTGLDAVLLAPDEHGPEGAPPDAPG